MTHFPDTEYQAGGRAERIRVAEAIQKGWEDVRNGRRPSDAVLESWKDSGNPRHLYDQGFRHAIGYALKMLQRAPALELSPSEQAVLVLLSDGEEHETNEVREKLKRGGDLWHTLDRLEKLGLVMHRTAPVAALSYWKIDKEAQEDAAVEADLLKAKLGLEREDFAVYPKIVLIWRESLNR